MIDEVALNPRFGGILVRACGKVTLASMLSALAAGIVHGMRGLKSLVRLGTAACGGI